MFGTIELIAKHNKDVLYLYMWMLWGIVTHPHVPALSLARSRTRESSMCKLVLEPTFVYVPGGVFTAGLMTRFLWKVPLH